MATFREKVINGLAWEALTKLIVQIISWASTIIVARLLAPEDYGVIAVSGVFVGLCMKIAGMGIGSAIIYQKNISKEELSSIFWSATILSCLAYLILYVAAPFIANFYDMPELTAILRTAGLIIVLSGVSVVPRSLVSKQMRFKLSAILNMVSGLVVTVSALIFAYLGYRYWSLVLSTLLGELILVLLYFYYERYIPQLFLKIGLVKEAYKYGFSILAGRIMDHLNTQWIPLIAGSVLGKSATGYFQMAYTLSSLPLTKIAELMGKIIFPAFASIQDERDKCLSVFLVMHKYLFIVSCPMFIGLALVADELVLLLLGEKWALIVVPMQLICIVNVLYISIYCIQRVLEGVGGSKALVVYQSICLVLFPIALLVGSHLNQLAGMLMAWGAVVPFGYMYLMYELNKRIGLVPSEFILSALPAAFATGLMAASIYLFQIFVVQDSAMLPIVVVISKIALGGVTYGAALLVIAPKDVVGIKKLVKGN